MHTTAPVSPTARVAPASLPRRFMPSPARLLAFWPALLAVALFLGLMGYEIHAVKAQEGGHFVYPLDDSYGHLATAKNLAQHGVWSYNAEDGFESSVSSLLWPPMIAVCFLIFGVHEQIPLILNILLSVAMLCYASEVLRRVRCPAVWRALTLVGIVLLVPLCPVVATGMEHSLQLLLTIAFVDLAARLLMDDSQGLVGRWTPWWLCVTGVLLVMSRYEGLFLVTATGLLLLFRKRWKLGIILGMAVITPTILFGLYSLHKGWYFVPNSLMIKGNRNPLTLSVAGLIKYFSRGYDMMMSEPHIPALTLAMAVALLSTVRHRRGLWTYPALVLTITLIAAAQHFQFASLGWFYRYEAYLIMLGIFGVGAVLGLDRPVVSWSYRLSLAGLGEAVALALAAVLFIAPMWPRSVLAYSAIKLASYSIYGQQYQMGRFIKRFYSGKSIIANDICAISFMGNDLHLTDIAGLSDIEVLRLRLSRAMTADDMRRIGQQRQARMAIIYEDWAKAIFQGPLPEWVKIGSWTIPQNSVCAGDTVSFYATSKEYAPELQSALQQFAPDLPKDVRQEGPYRGVNSLDPIGVYNPPGGVPAAWHFWTIQDAELGIFPADPKVVETPDASLSLAIFAISEDEKIEVYFNDEPVLTKVVSPAEARLWITFPVKVKWRPGRNVLKLVGHGTPKALDGGGPREVLFAVLDPRRLLNADGTVVAQPGVAQAQD